MVSKPYLHEQCTHVSRQGRGTRFTDFRIKCDLEAGVPAGDSLLQKDSNASTFCPRLPFADSALRTPQETFCLLVFVLLIRAVNNFNPNTWEA